MYYFCLCKSIKELFSSAPAQNFCAKAGAKVLLFSEPTKLFGENFRFLCILYTYLDYCQDKKLPTPYYIIYMKIEKYKRKGPIYIKLFSRYLNFTLFFFLRNFCLASQSVTLCEARLRNARREGREPKMGKISHPVYLC